MTHLEEKIFSRKLILASQSPRRAQLLKIAGFSFEVKPSYLNEDETVEPSPEKHVLSLSKAKAQLAAQDVDEGIVVGADTIVVLDQRILGKPKDEDDARDMLHRLSGRFHQVFTGFALVEKPGGRLVSDFEVTTVHFRQLADWEIDRYVKTASPMDKAGAYGIQDQSAVFADRIEGCFYNVVGFPLTRFYTAMMAFVTDQNQ
jgi:septum formation protein